ncbi:hypothetical protein U1Q18_002429 [Sarracenia purpurea var. burkii]
MIDEGSTKPELFNRYLPEMEPGYRYRRMVFPMLPKGMLVPPSGPSDRHNSAVYSSPDQPDHN